MPVKKATRFFFLSSIWAVFLVFLSLQPGEEVSKFLPYDILSSMAHAAVYLVLVILLSLAFRFNKSSLSKVCIFSLYLAIFWGIINELIQYWEPTRSPDVMDVLSDTIGALIGIGLFIVWRKRKKKRREKIRTY